MIVGYVRLSRDDNKRNYSSIENQRLLIEKYAKENQMQIEQWYEDDGFSGYSFQRPAFQEMWKNLENNIDVIIAKDLSRIGRHNAKVLLFLETVREMKKRLILIDDNYDTQKTEDDMIGIKTWYNEQYVKDSSKKIKSIIRTKQKQGSFLVSVPYGYEKIGKQEIKIDRETADYVCLIFNCYLNGMGFRAISYYLNEKKIPTASMMQRERAQANGILYKRKVTTQWSPAMIGTILKNDFYIGVLRQHKKERIVLNGKEIKINPKEQFIFKNNHCAIIEEQKFYKVQEILKERIEQSYRGQICHNNLFRGLLYCADCGAFMTAINRKNKEKYYICGNYNKNGKKFCSYSHIIYEKEVIKAIQTYFLHYLNTIKPKMKHFYLENKKYSYFLKKHNIENSLKELKEELKMILIKELKEKSDIAKKTYEEMKKEKIEKISFLESQMQDLEKKNQIVFDDVFQDIINGILNRQNVELLIEKITVEKDGSFEIKMKGKFYKCV